MFHLKMRVPRVLFHPEAKQHLSALSDHIILLVYLKVHCENLVPVCWSIPYCTIT